MAVFFESLSELNRAVPNRLSEGGAVVYSANAIDSLLRGDSVLLGSSPTKTQKKKLGSAYNRNCKVALVFSTKLYLIIGRLSVFIVR